jgi:hypothetical protein
MLRGELTGDFRCRCDHAEFQQLSVGAGGAVTLLLARILVFFGYAATSRILHDSSGDGHSFELLLKPIHPFELLKVLKS